MVFYDSAIVASSVIVEVEGMAVRMGWTVEGGLPSHNRREYLLYGNPFGIRGFRPERSLGIHEFNIGKR